MQARLQRANVKLKQGKLDDARVDYEEVVSIQMCLTLLPFGLSYLFRESFGNFSAIECGTVFVCSLITVFHT